MYDVPLPNMSVPEMQDRVVYLLGKHGSRTIQFLLKESGFPIPPNDDLTPFFMTILEPLMIKGRIKKTDPRGVEYELGKEDWVK